MNEPSAPPHPRKDRRRARRRLFRAIAVLAALTVVFAAGEVFVRVRYEITAPRPFFWPGIFESADPPLRWRHKVGYRGRYHQQFVKLQTTTNALGMRDPPLTPERREASRRILFLGDSITFGRGVADGECFARLLEDRWGEGTATFNAGVQGYDTVQELASLRAFGPELRPHLVVVGWYRNDVAVPSDEVAAVVIEGHFAADRESYEHWKARYIDHTGNPLDWSALIRFLRIQWKNYKLRRKLKERAEGQEEIPKDRGMLRSHDAIRQVNAWCAQSGARLAVVLFPAREEVEVQVAGREGGPGYIGIMAELCQAEEIPFLDLSERFRADWNETGQSLYLPRDRCHPNATGHARVGEWLEPWLTELLPAK